MKKNLWIWALAALSIAACTDEDLPTQQQQVVTENDWISPDGQVVVQLSADGLPVPSVSMGRAVIDTTNISALDSLGIFALNRTGGFETNLNSEILLNNVRARGKEEKTLDPSLHNNLQRISLYSDSAKHAAGTNASIYYYPVLPTCNYDFYGYYPRQKDANVNYTNDEFTVTFEPTDGSVDIITGKSVPAPVMWKGKLYAGKEKQQNSSDSVVVFNKEDLNGYNSKYIRSIKYHNWLMETDEESYPDSLEKQPFVPNIKFKHKTALLQFYIVAHNSQSGANIPPYNDREETRKLRVFDLTLEDVNTVATWAVKADTITWASPADLLMQSLTEEDYVAKGIVMDSVWQKKTFTMKVNAKDTTVTKMTMIPAAEKGGNCYQAGYMLVQPRANYQVTLSILAPNDNAGDAVPTTQTTTLTIPTEFKAGYRYNVYIQLYALQEVNISAELEGWQDYNEDINVPVE